MADTRGPIAERRKSPQFNDKLAHYVTEICGMRMDGFAQTLSGFEKQLGSLDFNTNQNSDSIELLRSDFKNLSEKFDGFEKSLDRILEIFEPTSGFFKVLGWISDSTLKLAIFLGAIGTIAGAVFWALSHIHI